MTHLLQKKQPTGENIFQIEVVIFTKLSKGVPIDAHMKNMYAKCSLMKDRGLKKKNKNVAGLQAKNIF